MRTNLIPWDLANDLIHRSSCRVKMAAVITDKDDRIFSWGWNHCGPDGMGMCAERFAIQRSNPKRLAGSTISIRGWNGVNKSVSLPCKQCYDTLMIAGVEYIECLNRAKTHITCRVDSLNRELLIDGRQHP